jgi:hypothetical protein
MYACSAHEPLELFRRIDQLLNLRSALVGLLQRRGILQGLIDGHADGGRHQFRDAVYVAVGHVQRAPHVLDGRLRRHGVERDDLRHLLPPVLARDIFDHLAAPVLAEVHIDIRHRHALRIQKALEEQHILQRIDIRDLHRIGHQRPRCRSAPRPHRYPVIARVLDEVPHDQEISRVVHLLDDAHFEVQTGFVLVEGRAEHSAQFEAPDRRLQTLLQALATDFLKVAVDRVPRRNRKFRKRIVHFVQLQVTALGKLHRAFHDLWRVREKLLHLRGRFHVELIGIEFEPLRIVDRRQRLYAQQDFMRVRVILAQIVAVVGGHQRNVQLFLQTEQVRLNLLLQLQALILNLEEEIPPAEDVLILRRRRARRLVLIRHQVLAQLAREAAGKPDQPLCMLRQIFLADARLSIEPVQRRLRRDANEIPIALLVLRQHQQMVVVVALRIFAMVILLADVQLAPQDRMHVVLFRRLEEVHRPVNVAVIGDCDRLLSDARNALDELFHVACAVQQRVVRMQMQMGEFRHVQLLCVLLLF